MTEESSCRKWKDFRRAAGRFAPGAGPEKLLINKRSVRRKAIFSERLAGPA